MRNTAIALVLLMAALPSTARADEPLDPEFEQEFEPPPEPQFQFGPKRSMTPALISTGVTAAVIAATVFSYVKFHNAATDRRHDGEPIGDDYLERRQAETDRQLRWRNRTIALTVGTVISASITGYLWSRRDERRRIAVTPTANGAEISYARSF